MFLHLCVILFLGGSCTPPRQTPLSRHLGRHPGQTLLLYFVLKLGRTQNSILLDFTILQTLLTELSVLGSSYSYLHFSIKTLHRIV